MAELTVSVAKDIASGQGATAWEVYQLARWFLSQHGIEAPPYRAVPLVRYGIAEEMEAWASAKMVGPASSRLDRTMVREWANGLRASTDDEATTPRGPGGRVDEAAVERAARFICATVGEDWDSIGDFARSVLLENQRGALQAASGGGDA